MAVNEFAKLATFCQIHRYLATFGGRIDLNKYKLTLFPETQNIFFFFIINNMKYYILQAIPKKVMLQPRRRMVFEKKAKENITNSQAICNALPFSWSIIKYISQYSLAGYIINLRSLPIDSSYSLLNEPNDDCSFAH